MTPPQVGVLVWSTIDRLGKNQWITIITTEHYLRKNKDTTLQYRQLQYKTPTYTT